MTRRALIAATAALLAHLAAAGAPPGVSAQAREIFRTIVGYRTSQGLGQVPAMAGFLARTFEAGGFPAKDIRLLPLGETASLVVRYRGTGEGGRPIALLAHMDVVTARREDWRRDPFTLVEENGYFFGRGTLDIKSEVALLTATFLRLKAEGFVPTRDLVIAFSGDEETEMATSSDLVTNHRELVDAEFALNGDGGEGVLDETTGKTLVYHLQGAEKATASFDLTVRSPGGHSSAPRPDNAIYRLADALERLQAYRFPAMWNEWTIASLKATAASTPGALGEAMRRFAADPGEGEAADAIAASPQNVGRTRTTCVATMLRGGHADNALPQSATATVNCRIFPGTAIDEVHTALKRVCGEGVEVRVLGTPMASGPSPMRADVVAAVSQAVHASWPDVEIVPDMVPYATEGVVYRAAGIPTYGVGSPFRKDSDEFSHGLDERIPVYAFYAGLEHWDLLVTTLADSTRR